MAIINSSNKKVLSKEHKICTSVWSKALGLMFSLKPRTLVFEFNTDRYVPLHMCFVFFPIDVLFLDKDMKVVEMKHNFKPWTFFSPKKKARYVIELENGAIKKTWTKKGDSVKIKD